MRTYKYDGKEYDFDAFKQAAINGFDSFAQRYGLSGTKAEKTRQAMFDILQHMNDDEHSYADLNRINFSSDYATTKGLFGKAPEKSKYYGWSTGYLTKVFNDMNPYEAPKPEEKPKTKVTRQWLGQQLVDALGDISTYTDEQKRAESARAFNHVLSRISGPDADYDIEEGYDLPTFRNWLQEGATAAGTADNFIDDNTYWGKLGIANPFYTKKTEQTVNDPLGSILDDIMGVIGSSDQTVRDKLRQTLADRYLSQYGLSLDQLGLLSTGVPTDVASPVNPGTVPEISPVKPIAPTTTLNTPTIKYSEIKQFIENNIDKDNFNNNDWKGVDAYMKNLIESQLKGQATQDRPALLDITINNKPYKYININSDKYYYAYSIDDKEMVVIPKKLYKHNDGKFYTNRKITYRKDGGQILYKLRGGI